MKDYGTNGEGSIVWVDKETLRYSKNGYSVLVWVDYEPGFFNRNRIIKISSLTRWNIRPDSALEEINDSQRGEIVSEIQEYFRKQLRRSRLA